MNDDYFLILCCVKKDNEQGKMFFPKDIRKERYYRRL